MDYVLGIICSVCRGTAKINVAVVHIYSHVCRMRYMRKRLRTRGRGTGRKQRDFVEGNIYFFLLLRTRYDTWCIYSSVCIIHACADRMRFGIRGVNEATKAGLHVVSRCNSDRCIYDMISYKYSIHTYILVAESIETLTSTLGVNLISF